MIKVTYENSHPCPLDPSIRCEKSEIYLEGENLSIRCNSPCGKFEFVKNNSDTIIIKN